MFHRSIASKIKYPVNDLPNAGTSGASECIPLIRKGRVPAFRTLEKRLRISRERAY
jgi:hypothetical protein